MPCILKITDPLLSSILGKAEFHTINELREVFEDVANRHSVLPLNIKTSDKDFTFRKFGKVYKEDGTDEVKLQIVMPGQEYFDQFELTNIPDELRDLNSYGQHDNKVLTFSSLDTFVSFYLANFLYISDTNYASLTKSVTNILDQTAKRLQGTSNLKHAGAIEDLKFAESLFRYVKLLYEYAGVKQPDTLNEVQELIQDKWNKYHQDRKEVSKTQTQAKQNVSDLFKHEPPKVPANLFFQAFDYVNGKENAKPLATARRNLIRAIEDPTKYRVRLVQGSVDQAQQTGDTNEYPSINMIENGVVGILVDENNNTLYLTKDNKLTTNPEQGIQIDYEVEGQKKKSNLITLLFRNSPLKDQFKQASLQEKETFIYNIENTKFQVEEKEFKDFSEAGFDIDDIQINIIADDPFAGFTYVLKDDRQIIVDSTSLNEVEIDEVIKLLEFTYEPDNLERVVNYLNDLLSVGADRIKKEKTGREIAFYPSVDKIMIHPFRVKTDEGYESVESEPIYYEEDSDLVRQSLRAARIRFRKGQGTNLQTSWDKYEIKDNELVKSRVKEKEGKQFYLTHIKKIKINEIRSSQIATFNERVIPLKDSPKPLRIGLLTVEKNKEYSIGEIYQTVFTPLTSSGSKEHEYQRQVWTTLYGLPNKNPKFIFTDYERDSPGYYDPNNNTVYLKYQTNEYLSRVILEEYLHAVTIPKLNKYKDTVEYQQLEKDYEKAKQLALTYKETEKYQQLNDVQKEVMDKIVPYYLQDIVEFTAGISYPHFRFFLTLGDTRDQSLLTQVIEKVKKLLNKILKDVAPSLYTDVTTDLFDFIGKKPSKIEEVIEQTQQTIAPELEQRKERPKPTLRKEDTFSKKYFAPPENGEVDMKTIEGLDAEISDALFSSGVFADFVQGNIETQTVWNRYYNTLVEDFDTADQERLNWIERFFDEEEFLKREWMLKSKLFKFNNEKILVNEEDLDLDETEEAEKADTEQGKDPGNNRVDSEQKYSRIQLADAYAKIFIRMIPGPRVNGLTTLSDFTNLWNRLQNKLKNTLSYDEQVDILNRVSDIPEVSIVLERLAAIPNDVNGSIIINSFQKSFSTVQVPVYNTYLTRTEQGFDYMFFQSPRLDIQNLEMTVNQNFSLFSESMMTNVRLGDRDIPTVDLKKLLDYLTKSKDLISTYRELGFPIPEVNKNQFLKESGLSNLHAGFIGILKARIGKWNGGESKNTIISNSDLIAFLKGRATWAEFGGKFGENPGLATLTNRFVSVLAEYSPLAVSNMTKNAEGENQSILLSWSSFLINVKKLNDGESFREKNPIFKYSRILNRLDSSNQVEPISLSGIRVQEGDGWKGTISMDEEFIEYVRQQIGNMMLSGTAEVLRAETKQTSLGYKFRWTDGEGLHPIKLDNFKTTTWQGDVLEIYGGYLLGELERIQLEKTNSVEYYSKYDSIKEDFHLFDFLSNNLKKNLLEGDPKESLKKNKNQIKKELVDYINNKVERLKEKVYTQTGINLTPSHPVLNPIQIQRLVKEMGFENFLRAFITNLDIYQIEHLIIGHGELGQFDKFYKRSGSNISTGVPVVVNSRTEQVLNNTIDRQFQPRIPTGRTFVIKDDILNYNTEKLEKDITLSLSESYKAFNVDKTDKEIKAEAKKKVEKYHKTNVADGQGFMSPDFGRLLMITTGTWTHDREKGFWFLKIQNKKKKGIALTKEEQEHLDKVNVEIEQRGMFWFFPPLKMQYRGEFIKESNVSLEGLDKFSLAWLWPDTVEGTSFEPILNKMLMEGYDYGKFESGTKIATFTPDDLLTQIREGNIDINIESGHDIDLTYMKEQVRASDKFKDVMPMSTQARKLVLSNLRFNGQYLSESIGKAATKWKTSQAEISKQNVEELLDKISEEGQINPRLLADQVSQEIKKRDLPQSLTSIFTLYGQPDYERFEQALSPQLVETLIYSLLKNKIVRPKFPGEHYIQVSSSVFEKEPLKFYTIEQDKVQPAECKIVLSGQFLKLLNIKEIEDLANRKSTYKQMSSYEKLEWRREKLNELLKDPSFVNEYRKELTVFSSRIPGQGYNSMDIQIVKEFLPTYLGPIIVPNPLSTVKSGTDFDFDKLPTITPDLNKEGKITKSRVNQMLSAVSSLVLDPINFHRLVTPNTTEDIDTIISNTLTALGENVSEPKLSQVLDFVTHLNKWQATKMKNSLGIGATNNTFYTLLQDANTKLNSNFEIVKDLVVPVRFPFEREDKEMSYPLLQSGVDKLTYVNEFINITVDIASNDAIGYTGLRRDNSALLLFLLENGVDFEDAFYFINQPIIFKYHQILSKYVDQGQSLSDAKNQVITDLLGIQTEQDGKRVSKNIVYKQINDRITKDKFSNLLSTIVSKQDINSKWNTSNQKEYLAYYLIGLEMANKMRDAQSYNNFDTRPSPNLLYSEAREQMFDQIKTTGLFDLESIENIHNDSVVSHLNVHELFKNISNVAFKIKRDPFFVRTSLSLGSDIYSPIDKESFFKKFDNDYLLAILQTFGTISKERIEKNLKEDLAKRWKEIKGLEQVKDLTLTKYVVQNHSTKNSYVSLTLFLGLDNDSQTLDQIAKDVRLLLNSTNKEVKQWAKDFIETGLYTTGFSQSPVYYLKALPFEEVNNYLKEAYDNFEQLSPVEKQNFVQSFSNRFILERGMQFSQYWLDRYKAIGIKNIRGKEKLKYFNQEAWRYTNYKLSLEELNQPEIVEMNQSIIFQEHPSPNYQDRTGINAQADATIAFAVNFNSRGELRTKEEVTKKGKKYIPIDTKSKEVTPELVQRIVNDLKSVNTKSLNIAGNGIYEPGIGTQQEVDNFVFELLQQVTDQYPIESIRTGGQTGYDEAGAKAGIKLGIPTTILAPKGWKFRNKAGTDISNEQQFKERFNVQPQPKQLDLFEQEQKDCDLDIPF